MFFVTAFLSCSILEERTECPCITELYISREYRNDLRLSFWIRDSLSHCEAVDYGVFRGGYNVLLPRTYSRLCAVKADRDNLGYGNVVVAKGSQMDSVYAYGNLLDCRGETASDTICLNKQFATMLLKFKNLTPDLCPFDMKVTGNVCGFSLPYFRPLDGEFECELVMREDTTALVRVPRQKDDSMELVFTRKEDGQLWDVVHLGRAIESSGYSWAEDNLSDMVMYVDFSRMDCSMTVEYWGEVDLGRIDY